MPRQLIGPSAIAFFRRCTKKGTSMSAQQNTKAMAYHTPGEADAVTPNPGQGPDAALAIRDLCRAVVREEIEKLRSEFRQEAEHTRARLERLEQELFPPSRDEVLSMLGLSSPMPVTERAEREGTL